MIKYPKTHLAVCKLMILLGFSVLFMNYLSPDKNILKISNVIFFGAFLCFGCYFSQKNV
ncbi:hypothetical protein [Methanococcus sp. CF]